MRPIKPTWDLLAAFAAVVRTGSLSAAARELGLAQPTVRRQIAELETALGCILFTRSRTGLLPTSAAEEVRALAETMTVTADALVRATSGQHRHARGVVRITCSEVVGVEILPQILASIWHSYPDIEFEISPTDRIEDVVRGDADLAIRMLRPTQSSLVARRACRIEMGLFASEAYLQSFHEPASPEELTRHRLVGDDRNFPIIASLEKQSVKLSHRDFNLRTDHGLTQLAAVRAGLGIGPVQVPLAGRSVPPLRRVLPNLCSFMETWVVIHEDLRQVQRNKLVFDALVEGLGAYARG